MTRRPLLTITFAWLFAGLVTACGQPQQTGQPAAGESSITPEEAREIAYEAYLYGISAVDNYRVYLRAISDPTHPVQMTPNKFNHLRKLVGPELGDTPNNDTLFSYAVLDLRAEPLVISVPEVEDDRVYMLQLGDTSTETLPYISSTATGTGAGIYALIGPDFAGYLPADRFDGILTTKGQFVAVTGRTAVDGQDDVPTVAAIQDAMTIMPLSEFLGTEPPADPGPLNFLTWDDEAAEGAGIFDYINMALAWRMPTHAEVPMLERFGRIGVVAGKRFTTDGMSPEVVAAIEEGAAAAKAKAAEVLETAMATPVGGGWFFTLENIAQFGNNYLLRAAISAETIYPNTPEEAMYGLARVDKDEETLNGANVYTVTFASDAPPPVKAGGFWSLTMYDDETTAMVPNALDRYSIGDRTQGLVYGDDGSLKVCMQVQEPEDPACNWLPAPEGDFYIIVRLYAPTEAGVAGDWTPPPVTRVK